MKLKTFFISYILFLSILLAAISTISIYFTNRQMRIINEQSVMEYERVINTIEREVNALYERGQANLIELILEAHREFQLQHNIQLYTSIIEEYDPQLDSPDIIITSFLPNTGVGYEFSVWGRLLTDYAFFEIGIDFDVTESIMELRQIQRTLLNLFILFSLIAAAILYFILNKIFQPLEQVALSTEKIAQGDYSERIQIAGTNELALMANNFNQMAEEIDDHITHLEDESERKQQFIDNLAHELRTPLTSIYGYAEYIQKAKLSEEEKFESTRLIMEEAGHMNKITNSMLDLAKLRDYEPELEEINIAELFNQLESSLTQAFQTKNLEFVVESADGYISGQSDLIRSLVANLCMNAANASTSGGKVVLKATTTSHGAEITVSDDGCGIEAHHIAKLTEPFYQIDNARNKLTDGIGLGLAIVKQIVDIHGAELVFESEVGVGTEVKVIFTTS